MTQFIDKQTALRILCVARQAERSIDFGLHSERQWELLREYYDAARLQPVLEAIAQLQARTQLPDQPISKYRAFRLTAWRILTIPIRWFMNRFRKQWRFSRVETQFLLSVLCLFGKTLKCVAKPDGWALVELRMDLHTCELIISDRLIGIPQVEKAMHVEHFCQNDYLRFVSIEDVCETPPLVAA